jgi:hypothetical protein
MRPITKLFLGTTAATAAASAYICRTYIYVGDYLEVSPYNPSNLPLLTRVNNSVFGTTDDVKNNLAVRLSNPGKNELAYDFFEKELDAATSKKILQKYKTNEEVLGAMQKALLLGPTLWPHRFVISKYFHNKVPSNSRISGFKPLEPELRQTDVEKLPELAQNFPLLPYNPKLNYIWDREDIVKYTRPFPQGSVIFGIFTQADHGKRSNGGYSNFLFGSDLLPVAMVHRIEYYTKKDKYDRDILVFRLTNVSSFTAPNSPVFVDETNGLHEFMTRTMVLDMIRGIEY